MEERGKKTVTINWEERYQIEVGICDICLREDEPVIFPTVGYCPHTCKDCLSKLVERIEEWKPENQKINH